MLSMAQPVGASPGSTDAPSSSRVSPSPVVPSGAHVLTLITGDVVTTRRSAGKGGTVEVRDADGGPADARVMESGGDLYVLPDAALPYIAGGTLDRRLFNITDLVSAGYDDKHRDRLPLIVSYTDAATARRAADAPGSRTVRRLAAVDGAALTAVRDKASVFWRAVTSAPPGNKRAAASAFSRGITHIWLDGVVEPALAESTSQIGAPEAWASGDTGQGVDIAVLDTGVDAGHPDLTDRITASRSFVPTEDVTDRNGHGTHVASTIAGTGAASDGKERGVAPGADLHIGKVLSDAGQGQDSWVLAGMEWAAVDQRADIVSMSLGSDAPSDGTDPLSQAVNHLSAETGALFVIAAGNNGAPESIGGPGAADSALTVGAVDSSDTLAPFSSQGPRTGNGGLKPEITAPGVDILAARSRFAPEGEGSYQTLSGTSMATPHVAGAAALVLAARPELTGQQLKDLLVSTSERTPRYNAFEAGSGRVDIPSALRANVIATATASAGQASAGQGGSATRRPVTYTNTRGAPVTLSLSVSSPDAPAGMFRLSTERVVVPAHSTASVTLTIDASKAAGRGRWTGQILAADSSGNVVAHTAVSLGAAAHKLTLLLKDGHGKPMSGVVEVLRSGDWSPAFYLADESGRIDTFVPEDVYSVLAFKAIEGTHGPRSLGMALLGDPDVTIDKDTTVTLDVRKVARVDMTAPQQTEVTYQRLEYDRAFGGSNWRDYMETQTSFDSLWAQPTTHKVTHGDFWMSARWRKERPALSVTSRSGPLTDILRQEGITPLPVGRHRLPLVAAGNGGEADYAALEARGKAVVVRLNNVVTPAQQASAAVLAGARLLLVVNDRPGRQSLDFRPAPLTTSPIDVALLSPDEGERLIRDASTRGAMVTADARSLSPYVYDLMWTWHQQIPRKPVIKGSAKTLAKVDVTFAGPSSSSAGEWRYDFPDYSDWGIGLPFQRPTTGHRVDWVATGSGYVWGQEAYVDGMIYEIEPRITYRPGTTAAQHWFEPIERPHLNNNYKLPTRNGSRLNLDVPAWGSADHVGMSMDYYRMRQSLTLYQGNTRLADGLYTQVSADAPGEESLPYRLIVDGSRDATVSPYSTTTHTQWDFVSEAPPEGGNAVLPLIQLDYRVATDTHGRADRRARFSVSAGHLPKAVGSGRVSPVTVELSYDDGRSWRRVSKSRSGLYGIAPTGGAHFVSLRATAHDSAGNAVTQTVIRAFGLR